MSKIKDFEITELLDGNNSDCPYIDSEDEENEFTTNSTQGNIFYSLYLK